jgi:SAM-dependent methyltransferase
VFDVLGEQVVRLAANRANVSRDDVTEKALLRADGRGAYPVVDGIPILLAPEMLVGQAGADLIDTDQDPYREAYEEMAFYNAVAADAHSDVSHSDAYEVVSRVVDAGDFPGPEWLDATYDLASQADAYDFMSPMADMSALQLGGSGIHAVKFLLAGASESWLLTPMLGEAVFARELAAAFGVETRFRSVVGIAEEIPFRNKSFDRVYSGGCIHHTITDRAFPEIRRVLDIGGKFAAIEPWRAPGYQAGIDGAGPGSAAISYLRYRDRISPWHVHALSAYRTWETGASLAFPDA